MVMSLAMPQQAFHAPSSSRYVDASSQLDNYTMKIAILSRSPKCYSTRRLKEAAEARGHHAVVLNTLSCSIEVEKDEPGIIYRGKPLSYYDAVIPRIGASITFFGLAVLRQFEQMGVYTINPARAIARSRDCGYLSPPTYPGRKKPPPSLSIACKKSPPLCVSPPSPQLT